MANYTPMVKEIFTANDAVAAEGRAAFDAAGLLAVNLMSSPGAGKAGVIPATLGHHPSLRVDGWVGWLTAQLRGRRGDHGR
jgi:hydrogenase nickel incorporation protein HypB